MKRLVWFVMLLASVQLFASVNLNTASAEELAALKGIGPKMAEKIIDYRHQHGFKDTRELMNFTTDS